jgi:hypothetical protein
MTLFTARILDKNSLNVPNGTIIKSCKSKKGRKYNGQKIMTMTLVTLFMPFGFHAPKDL